MSQGHFEGRLSFTINEAVSSTGINRSAIYKAIGSGVLKSFKVGRRRMVSAKALQLFISELEKAGEPRSSAA